VLGVGIGDMNGFVRSHLKGNLRLDFESISALLFGLGLGFVRIEPAPVDLFLVSVFMVFLRRLRGLSLLPLAVILLFGGWHVVPLFLGEIPSFGRAMFYMGVTGLMILYWLFTMLLLRRERNIWFFVWAVGVSGTLNVLSGLLEYMGFPFPFGSVLYGDMRLQGFFKDPNVLGSYLVLSFLLLLGGNMSGRRNILTLFFAIIVLMGIFLSFSRGAWVGLMAAVLVVVSWPGVLTTRLRFGVISLLILGISMLAVLNLFDPSFASFFHGRLGLKEYDSDRFATQAVALRAGLETWVGIGPGQSEIVFQYATHSLYARIWAEQGPMGLALFSVFLVMHIVVLLRRIFRSHEGKARVFSVVLLAAVVGILINSLVIDSLHWRHFWVLLGFSWGYATSLSHHSR